MSEHPRYSIVAPIYNEEGNIQKLYERVSQVMDSTGESWELVTVNDGSRALVSDSGNFWPFNCVSLGLGSNKSI